MSAVFSLYSLGMQIVGRIFRTRSWSVQAEEIAGRIIFVKTTPQRRRVNYVIRQQNSLSRCIQGQI